MKDYQQLFNSIWMWQTQELFHKPSHSQMGQNPELRTLFYKLAWLLQACVVPMFVFDGSARPTKKHGHIVHKHPHWMTSKFQSMITAFGFYYHEVSHCLPAAAWQVTQRCLGTRGG